MAGFSTCPTSIAVCQCSSTPGDDRASSSAPSHYDAQAAENDNSVRGKQSDVPVSCTSAVCLVSRPCVTDMDACWYESLQR